jgi:hypothetical protein
VTGTSAIIFFNPALERIFPGNSQLARKAESQMKELMFHRTAPSEPRVGTWAHQVMRPPRSSKKWCGTKDGSTWKT